MLLEGGLDSAGRRGAIGKRTRRRRKTLESLAEVLEQRENEVQSHAVNTPISVDLSVVVLSARAANSWPIDVVTSQRVVGAAAARTYAVPGEPLGCGGGGSDMRSATLLQRHRCTARARRRGATRSTQRRCAQRTVDGGAVRHAFCPGRI